MRNLIFSFFYAKIRIVVLSSKNKIKKGGFDD